MAKAFEKNKNAERKLYGRSITTEKSQSKQLCVHRKDVVLKQMHLSLRAAGWKLDVSQVVE